MTSREKFEAWYLENWGHTEDDHETMFERYPDSDEEYYRLGVRMAHEAWQAAELVSGKKLTDMAVQLANAESKCSEMAAELSAVDKIHNEAVFITDDHYEQCPPEVQKIIRSLAVLQIPAYDAFLAEVLASAIPEGYVLVPKEMYLSSEAMEGICFHCGDGGFAFGEFTDGLLFVGAIDDSDGQKIHGLHIATADYPEEGCATICEFLPSPIQGADQ